MKFVISTKSGKAYSKNIEEAIFLGKRIGDTVKLDDLGLTGFEAEIKGGSDKQGFPMHKTVKGIARKKILSAKGLGFKKAKKGERKRHSVRGNTLSAEISQINLLVTKEGSKKIEDFFETKKEAKEEEISAKEKALKLAKETAGTDAVGDAPTKKGRH